MAIAASGNDNDGSEMQGRHLLGSTPDDLGTAVAFKRYNSVPLSLAHFGTVITVSPASTGAHLLARVHGEVVHAEADPWFEGLKLGDGAGGAIRIRAVETRKAGPRRYSSTTYFLEYNPGNGTWHDYCGDPEIGAVAIAGGYDGRRVHSDGTEISFACSDGVAAKCTDWGYIAGNAGPGDHDWDRHQACTMMANASYCGDGTPHTRELTPILIRDYDAAPFPYPDLALPDPVPGDPDAYLFEAAWGVKGAICLSRARWMTLPPDPCPGVLPDPRDDGGGEFCEDLTYADLAERGAHLVNGSKRYDALLMNWSNGTDLVGTMWGYVDSHTTVAPFPGYTSPLPPSAIVLRNLPGSIDEREMRKLSMWVHTGNGDRVLSESAPSSAYAAEAFDSYVFRDPTRVPNLRPLWQCINASGRYTSTAACGGALLGYVLPPP